MKKEKKVELLNKLENDIKEEIKLFNEQIEDLEESRTGIIDKTWTVIRNLQTRLNAGPARHLKFKPEIDKFLEDMNDLRYNYDRLVELNKGALEKIKLFEFKKVEDVAENNKERIRIGSALLKTKRPIMIKINEITKNNFPLPNESKSLPDIIKDTLTKPEYRFLTKIRSEMDQIIKSIKEEVYASYVKEEIYWVGKEMKKGRMKGLFDRIKELIDGFKLPEPEVKIGDIKVDEIDKKIIKLVGDKEKGEGEFSTKKSWGVLGLMKKGELEEKCKELKEKGILKIITLQTGYQLTESGWRLYENLGK